MNNLTSQTDLYCLYYQAHVYKSTSWFVVAVLKSFDHVSLDRTVDVENSIFEFFVPASMNDAFIQITQELHARGYMDPVQLLPNRLTDPNQQV